MPKAKDPKAKDPKATKLVLTQPQAACLIALREGIETPPKIAMEAKLALAKTSAVLRMLARLRTGRTGSNQTMAYDKARKSMPLRDRPGSTAA